MVVTRTRPSLPRARTARRTGTGTPARAAVFPTIPTHLPRSVAPAGVGTARRRAVSLIHRPRCTLRPSTLRRPTLPPCTRLLTLLLLPRPAAVALTSGGTSPRPLLLRKTTLSGSYLTGGVRRAAACLTVVSRTRPSPPRARTARRTGTGTPARAVAFPTTPTRLPRSVAPAGAGTRALGAATPTPRPRSPPLRRASLARAATTAGSATTRPAMSLFAPTAWRLALSLVSPA